jgi:hypothetical protein
MNICGVVLEVKFMYRREGKFTFVLQKSHSNENVYRKLLFLRYDAISASGCILSNIRMTGK